MMTATHAAHACERGSFAHTHKHTHAELLTLSRSRDYRLEYDIFDCNYVMRRACQCLKRSLGTRHWSTGAFYCVNSVTHTNARRGGCLCVRVCVCHCHSFFLSLSLFSFFCLSLSLLLVRNRLAHSCVSDSQQPRRQALLYLYFSVNISWCSLNFSRACSSFSSCARRKVLRV